MTTSHEAIRCHPPSFPASPGVLCRLTYREWGVAGEPVAPARAVGASRAGGGGPRSLVEFLAWAVGVVQQQLAGCELAAVDGLVLPQLVHQLLGSVRVCVPEGTCRGQGDTSVPRKREAPRARALDSADPSSSKRDNPPLPSLSAWQHRTLLPACPPALNRGRLDCWGQTGAQIIGTAPLV